MNAKLLCVDRGAAAKRAVAFYSGPDCTQLLTTVVSSKRFNRVNSSPEFKDFALSFVTDILELEIDTLTSSKDSQCMMKSFTPEHIEKFTLELLDAAHRRHAPLLRNLLHRMTKADPYPPGRGFTDNEPARSSSGAHRQHLHTDCGLISITALCMLCYGRSDRSNALQGLVGYFLFATNTAKRCTEVLHRLGLSVAYETVIRALRDNGDASHRKLLEAIRHHRFFVCFDNMNFYRNVRDQRQHNRGHQVNYTAGYVCLMNYRKEECSANEAECKCGPLPANSINYAAAKELSYTDIDLDTPDMRYYVTAAFRTAMGEVLMRYFEEPMGKQRMTKQDGSPGEALYQVDAPPFEQIRARKGRAKILTMRTFDRDEASIAGTVDVLKDICNELGILKQSDSDDKPGPDGGIEVGGSVVMLHGDYLTVRNVTRAMMHRAVEPNPVMRFQWVEPVAGLLHLQMNVLKMLLHTFEGGPTDPSSLKRHQISLRYKGVHKEVRDFHACDEFFRLVAEGHIIGLFMHRQKLQSIQDINLMLESGDWPKAIHDTLGTSIPDLLHVCNLWSTMSEGIEEAVEQRIEEMRTERKRLIATRRLQRVEGMELPVLKQIMWSRVRKELEKELAGPARDIVNENAVLFVQCALIYLDFHYACRGGFSGRVEKCIQLFAVMFHGTRFSNYASECLHLVACLKRIWGPEFKKAWMDYCLIDPDGRGVFCAVDRHGETVIRENKDKVRPSANAKDDDFLRITVARNIPSLLACKQAMKGATGARGWGNRHSTVKKFSDVISVASSVVEERIFDHIPGRGTEDVDEVADLIARGSETLLGPAILEYRKKARANWMRADGTGAEDTDQNEGGEDGILNALEGYPRVNFDEDDDD